MNGRIAVGTGSSILIDLAEELRLLEYGQRLVMRQSNALSDAGRLIEDRLFSAALSGGAQALGIDPAELAGGAPTDPVALADPLDLLRRWCRIGYLGRGNACRGG